ncbi:MAG: riboflavin synthase [Bacteroidetes bacterium]|nr:riboflavin synthase [Bacteroidota bacterium]
MFTGLIEEIGVITNLVVGSKSAQITINVNKEYSDLKIGDSICTNGACLTVTHLAGQSFTVDVMAETLRSTTLGALVPGEKVNLERALKASDRFGGHIVSGHIDGTAKIIDIKKEGIASLFSVRPAKELMKYIINKGSVAVDGISLTVSKILPNYFVVSIIPHTASNTTLLSKRTGDTVNIETDTIAKYIDKLTNNEEKESNKKKSSISINSLIKNGF